MEKRKLIKNLKIFSAVVVLSVSSYNLHDMEIGTNYFHTTIEKQQSFDDLGDYVLQGLCKCDDKYLLTAYDWWHNDTSIIYILDDDLEEYTIKKLDTYSHVGGITYDPVNENIWITDTNGTISCYAKEEILSTHKITDTKRTVYVGDGLMNIFGDRSAAYVTYHDNKLYVGNFNFQNNTIIKEFEIKENGMIDTHDYREIKGPGFIQGITFYEDKENDKKYLLTSSSFGRHFNSNLRIYDFNTLEKVNHIKTKEMMEEIIIDDDKLITVYESNAKNYNKKDEKGADIIISNINKILSKK